MVDGGTLICDLEARLTHSKVHGVHIDLSWVGLTLSWFSHIGIDVMEEWNPDINFLSTSLSDRFYQAGKSRVSIDGLINDKFGSACFIDGFKVILVLFYLLGNGFILYHNMFFCSKRWSVWHTQNHKVLITEIFMENVPSAL